MKTRLTKKKVLIAFLLIAMIQISQKVMAQEHREFKKMTLHQLTQAIFQKTDSKGEF